MVVTVISRTIQEYRGERYYLCGKYFQRAGRRLHVAVWEDQNGRKVPDGHDVHHRDHDRSHNQPGNLEAKPRGKHISDHQLGHERGIPPKATAAAARWHGTDEGLAWHHRHYEAHKHLLHRQDDFKCDQCGAAFTAADNGQNRFCSNGCKTKWRKASGIDNETRHCVRCKTDFVVNRYSKTATCGRTCAAAVSGDKRRRKG
jgi:hypothetical protein